MSPHRLVDSGPGRWLGALLLVALIASAVAFGVVLHNWIENANDANYADHLRSCQAQNGVRERTNRRLFGYEKDGHHVPGSIEAWRRLQAFIRQAEVARRRTGLPADVHTANAYRADWNVVKAYVDSIEGERRIDCSAAVLRP
jgi:hypothetical protein